MREEKFKWFTTHKLEQGFCLIGKNGNFRFKQEIAKIMSFEKGERWLVGIDMNEQTPKHIYIIRPENKSDTNGFKMTYQNKSWSIAAKTVIKELGLKIPLKCKIEKYIDEKHEGLKITLPIP